MIKNSDDDDDDNNNNNKVLMQKYKTFNEENNINIYHKL